MATGRQSEFTQDAAILICNRISEGQSIRNIAKQLTLAPSTIFKWLVDHPSFSEQYTRAKEAQAELLADEIISIADQAKTGEDAQIARVRVDSRKWVASKLLPQKYGERLLVSGQIIQLSLPASAMQDFAPVLEGKQLTPVLTPEHPEQPK